MNQHSKSLIILLLVFLLSVRRVACTSVEQGDHYALEPLGGSCLAQSDSSGEKRESSSSHPLEPPVDGQLGASEEESSDSQVCIEWNSVKGGRYLLSLYGVKAALAGLSFVLFAALGPSALPSNSDVVIMSAVLIASSAIPLTLLIPHVMFGMAGRVHNCKDSALEVLHAFSTLFNAFANTVVTGTNLGSDDPGVEHPDVEAWSRYYPAGFVFNIIHCVLSVIMVISVCYKFADFLCRD